MIKVKIGTTPTHNFTFPFSAELFDIVEITYAQKGKVVLQKRQEECEITDKTVTTRLTQEDTFLFSQNVPVEIQIRCVDEKGEVYASNIIFTSAEKCLSNEVL
jgi:hypothetical protein